MDIHKLNSIYFLGIGGIGMSALSRYFKAFGVEVNGYDKTRTPLTIELEKEGMAVHYEVNPALIPQNCDLVIYTPAVPADFEEWAIIKERNLPSVKRSEALALICKGKSSIAVAGTHGKTTVTSMIAHILKKSNFPVNAFVGGLMTEYGTNVFINPDASWVLVEADEYDRSFLRLDPDIAVVNAIDADHLDIYGSKKELELAFEQFMHKTKNHSSLIFNSNIEAEYIEQPKEACTFSAKKEADFTAQNIRVENGVFVFDIIKKSSVYIQNAQMPMPGRHNIENALAAVAVADKLHIQKEKINDALASFRGVKRRFERICQCNGKTYYDDYAHHPEEIKALITAVRELHPGKRICGIFQPHLFTRTRDFADGFAESLELLDRAVVTDIYPAREKALEGINADFLLEKMDGCIKEYIAYKDVAAAVCRFPEEIILSIGAGDIDRLVPEIDKNLRNCS